MLHKEKSSSLLSIETSTIQYVMPTTTTSSKSSSNNNNRQPSLAFLLLRLVISRQKWVITICCLACLVVVVRNVAVVAHSTVVVVGHDDNKNIINDHHHHQAAVADAAAAVAANATIRRRNSSPHVADKNSTNTGSTASENPFPTYQNKKKKLVHATSTELLQQVSQSKQEFRQYLQGLYGDYYPSLFEPWVDLSSGDVLSRVNNTKDSFKRIGIGRLFYKSPESLLLKAAKGATSANSNTNTTQQQTDTIESLGWKRMVRKMKLKLLQVQLKILLEQEQEQVENNNNGDTKKEPQDELLTEFVWVTGGNG